MPNMLSTLRATAATHMYLGFPLAVWNRCLYGPSSWWLRWCGHATSRMSSHGRKFRRAACASCLCVLLSSHPSSGSSLSPTSLVRTVSCLGCLFSGTHCACVWSAAPVGIAAFFGTVSGLSESMVGITILAIGNSVNDLAADVTIARAGFPSMAIAGAYAGPMFSAWLQHRNVAAGVPGLTTIDWLYTDILFGLGVPLLIEIAKNGAVSLGQDSVTVNYSLLCAAGFVVFSLVTVAASGFRVTRPIGGALLFLYGVFFVFLVIIQVKH